MEVAIFLQLGKHFCNNTIRGVSFKAYLLYRIIVSKDRSWLKSFIKGLLGVFTALVEVERDIFANKVC
jgi:hypothetical protein